MKSFNILALDENFQIIGIVSYTSLQWSRKFHESGTFSLSVPLGQYKNNWKYIYSPDRKEVGEISQINYVSKDGFNQMYVSGYFLEEELNRMIVYPYTKYNQPPDGVAILDQFPSSIYFNQEADWINQTGNASNVAHKFFNSFKTISFKNFDVNNPNGEQIIKSFTLDILDGTSEAGTYKTTDDTRNGEYLGEKIYSILKPSGASYRVRFDFQNGKKYFDVIIGKDRTEDNGTNNPIIFSTKYGNIINPNILISNSDYKDSVIQGGEITKRGNKIGEIQNPDVTSTIALANTSANAIGNFCYIDVRVNIDDDVWSKQGFGDFPDFKRVATYNAIDELKDRGQVINVDFDSVEGSYEYMVDFDLGDLVSIEIPEIDLSADARLIGCYETIQNGVWNLALEFGTPILRNR